MAADERYVSLDDLELLETIGTAYPGVGTYGRVRLCRIRQNLDSGEIFALKIMKKERLIRMKQVDHVKSEKRLLERLSHPFICHLYFISSFGAFQDELKVYLLSEFVPGGELWKRLKEEGRFPNDVALFYAAEVVCALGYLHSQSVVYRDLKPENILITVAGHIKLVDFGFAKALNGPTFTMCGTPEYLSPEAVMRTGHSVTADWWAFGILLYELLIGNPPFQHENPYKLYDLILNAPVPLPDSLNQEAKELISKLLTRDVQQRLGTVVSSSQGDAKQVMLSEWFEGVDFDTVERREIPPPWLPEVASERDSSLFDNYPDSTEGSSALKGADPFVDF